MSVNQGKEFKLSVTDTAGPVLVEVPNQGTGTYKTGKTANVTVHKNGQTPWGQNAGASYETDFTIRRPMDALHADIFNYADASTIVPVVIQDTASGGLVYTGNAMLTIGDHESAADGGPVTIPLTVTFDGEPVRSVTA